jgi:phage baseplate assembly protein W
MAKPTNAGFGIAPVLPMSITPKGGIFLHVNPHANNRQQLKMLFLTNPGERIMNSDYGVGIKKYLFEPESITPVIRERIVSQVGKYMPHITLTSLELVPYQENLGILVAYHSSNGDDQFVIGSSQI